MLLCIAWTRQAASKYVIVLTTGAESGVVLIEITINLFHVTIFGQFITIIFMKIFPKLLHNCTGINGGNEHDGLVKVWGSNFLGPIDFKLIVIAVGEDLGLGLYGKCVVDTMPCLLSVLH